MTRIAIIVGSTRPGRRSAQVAAWVADLAASHQGEAEYEVVDIADFGLPILDEPIPAAFGAPYTHEHTRVWSEKIASFDGYVFVTAEYNHSYPAALKNAIDFLYPEWNEKAAGIVSFGPTGGIRAAEHLRAVLSELRVAHVRTHVSLAIFTDFQFEDPTNPASPFAIDPAGKQTPLVNTMLDQVLSLTNALRPLREQLAAA